jgi:hypothetical protein
MILAAPYPVELLRVAKKVVWYDRPEDALADLPAFLVQVMVYGSAADVETVERVVPAEEFRKGNVSSFQQTCAPCNPSANVPTDSIGKNVSQSQFKSGEGIERMAQCVERTARLA